MRLLTSLKDHISDSYLNGFHRRGFAVKTSPLLFASKPPSDEQLWPAAYPFLRCLHSDASLEVSEWSEHGLKPLKPWTKVYHPPSSWFFSWFFSDMLPQEYNVNTSTLIPTDPNRPTKEKVILEKKYKMFMAMTNFIYSEYCNSLDLALKDSDDSLYNF